MIILWIFLSALVGMVIGGLLGTAKRADLVDEVRILRTKLYECETAREYAFMTENMPNKPTPSRINSKAINSEEEA